MKDLYSFLTSNSQKIYRYIRSISQVPWLIHKVLSPSHSPLFLYLAKTNHTLSEIYRYFKKIRTVPKEKRKHNGCPYISYTFCVLYNEFCSKTQGKEIVVLFQSLRQHD